MSTCYVWLFRLQIWKVCFWCKDIYTSFKHPSFFVFFISRQYLMSINLERGSASLVDFLLKCLFNTTVIYSMRWINAERSVKLNSERDFRRLTVLDLEKILTDFFGVQLRKFCLRFSSSMVLYYCSYKEVIEQGTYISWHLRCGTYDGKLPLGISLVLNVYSNVFPTLHFFRNV